MLNDNKMSGSGHKGWATGKILALQLMALLVVLVVLVWLALRGLGSGREVIDPASMKLVGTVSDRFLSYNVEMVEVTGGRFWRPYKDGKQEGDDRYEYRPPLDLSDPRLTALAAALGPAYMRVSGTWANATYFDPDNSTRGKAPEGFDSVLTGEQWRAAVEFSRRVDAAIVTSFATSPGARDDNGVWQWSLQAEPWLAYTQNLGAEIAAAEFANEPETVELTQAPAGYTPEDYRRDYSRFHDWLSKASPSTLILGPGAAELGQPNQFLRKWASGLTVFEREDLMTRNEPAPDAVSFHFYGGGSERCGKIPVIGFGKEDALSSRWLGLIDKAIATTGGLRDQVAPGAPLWITETGETACGGNPWASTFTDVFRFTDQLARSARQGVQVYMHNTLAASDYGLLDDTTHRPRPNYWAAWLWRQFMGTKVLDAGKGTSDLHLYAHCLRDQPGGVAVLAINLDPDNTRTVQAPAAAQLYVLTEGNTPDEAMVNGTVLALTPDNDLPLLEAVPVEPGELTLSPASLNYIVFPGGDSAACQ
ncbi:hypothetical protein G8770_16290 [Aestuariicella hydrocarbonica]|uniref:Uncharacterized protein n=1 Tax=Pseudomaricurvus hydrocarbonicus TaxID=1470433 RepID=A0A9E5MMR6_9GAMM|nr:hypothetical protein [Aestuariicella hydrocarbonica]NHO67108.1 hypothetical protein [Aestuariicella hydrocarbonica]